MGVDVTHLVLEALGDTNDHVVDERTDGTESSDVLAGTVVHLDLDGGGIGLLEGDGQVTKVLLEGATGTLNGDLAGLDSDLDCAEVPSVFIPLYLRIPSGQLFLHILAFRYPPSAGICRIRLMTGSGGILGITHRPQGPSGLPRSECTSFWRLDAVVSSIEKYLSLPETRKFAAWCGRGLSRKLLACTPLVRGTKFGPPYAKRFMASAPRQT